MDLDAEFQANAAEGFFVVTFFNDWEKCLTEPTLKYIFSKFGHVTDSRVFIFYKEKQEALKALEIMNMGTKFHVDIDRQPVKKNETEKRIPEWSTRFFLLPSHLSLLTPKEICLNQ